jgi:uncharacterized membrane protein YeaQ/YmgE (transglycosylase-associated protein family)
VQDIKDFVDFLVFVGLGFIVGLLAEAAARRKIWIPTIQRGFAIIIGLVGALIGSFILNDLFKVLDDPAILDVSVFPALIGGLLLLIPWWLVRSGRTKLSQNRKWRSNYWRK